MFVCLYTEIDELWNDQKLAAKLQLLPEKMQKDLLIKKIPRNRQQSITGKLLLIAMLDKFGLSEKFSLGDLLYNQYRRPYFDAAFGFDFSLAHSGNMIICCGTDKGKAGIDIEYMKKIEVTDYTAYFTPYECDDINNNTNPADRFYYYWTRKEAVLKAMGTGMHTDLDTIDVSGKKLEYNNITYCLQELNIDAKYKCHIATTAIHSDIEINRINF